MRAAGAVRRPCHPGGSLQHPGLRYAYYGHFMGSAMLASVAARPHNIRWIVAWPADTAVSEPPALSGLTAFANTARCMHGIPALTWDATLTQAAQSEVCISLTAKRGGEEYVYRGAVHRRISGRPYPCLIT
jgi:hypothetical protein